MAETAEMAAQFEAICERVRAGEVGLDHLQMFTLSGFSRLATLTLTQFRPKWSGEESAKVIDRLERAVNGDWHVSSLREFEYAGPNKEQLYLIELAAPPPTEAAP